MPVSNIALVTSAIIAEIKKGLNKSGLTSTEVYPDSIMREEERAGLYFYLYHIKENSRYKNVQFSGADYPPVKLNSMGLDLYYQLTAYSTDSGNGQAALFEQEIMTAALKALHDAPMLTVGNDHFRVTLQPTPANDAVHNWTAGSLPMKLSAYYEVTPVLLEPESPTIYSGRVLMYGNYIFTAGMPRITSSRSIIEFTLPEEATVRQIIAQPAQAPPGSDIIFEGSGLNAGTSQQLRLFNFQYKENIVAPGWDLRFEHGQLSARVKETANLERNGAVIDILPGIYTAQVVVTKVMELPGGGTKEFKQNSNQFPFIVMPAVDQPSSLGVMRTITGNGFQVKDDSDEDFVELMEVYIGEHRLYRRSPNPEEGEPHFRVVSKAEMKIKLTETLGTGTMPFRVRVAGAESLPLWITIP